MKKPLYQKLTSRKFWMAAVTAVAGIFTMILGEREAISVLAGAAMTVIPTVVYCIIEGVLDAGSVRTVTQASVSAAQALGADPTAVTVLTELGKAGEILVQSDSSDPEA